MRQLLRCNTRLGSLVMMGLIIIASPTWAHACSVCVGSAAADYGYFWGVLFLMSMPFVLGGGIGGWLWYHYRRPWTGLSTSASMPHVRRAVPQPAATTSASDGRDNGSQVMHAETCGATAGDRLPKEKESRP
jgi:hypothetical protein